MIEDRSNFLEDESSELSFTVPWGVIAAKAWGNPSCPPVLMVHGIQDNASAFDRLMALLPKTFYYVNIDLPGHGRSSMFPKGIYLDFMLYLSSIRRVIQQLSWTEFYYIGHSLGGQLGYYYASMYPEEVKKLITIDTLGQLRVPADEFIKHYREYYNKLLEIEGKISGKAPPGYTYEEALYRIINHRPTPITKDAAKALLKRSLKQNNNLYCFSMDQRLKAGIRTPVTSEQHINILSKIQCPVLLIITNSFLNFVKNNIKDSFHLKTLELFETKKNFHLVSVEGHHDVHNNNPDIVAPHITKFVLQQKSFL